MVLSFNKLSLKQSIIFFIYCIGISICTFIIPTAYQFTYFQYTIYLSLGLFLVTISDLLNNHNAIKSFLYIAAFTVFGFLMAFRAQTGIDDWQYRNSYLSIGNLGISNYFIKSNFEFGYKLLNCVIYLFCGQNYNIAQTITTFFTFMLWAIAIKKYDNYCSSPVMMLVLFSHYYLLMMGAGLVRMFIAVPIVLYAIYFLHERNAKIYLVFIFIASLFHLSALFMLVLVVFAIKKTDWFYIHWKLFTILLCVLTPVIFIIIAQYIVPLLSAAKYSSYGKLNKLSLSIGSFDVLPIWMIGAINFRYIEEDRNRLVISMVLISLSIIISIFSSMVAIGRLIYYANLGIVLILGELAKIKTDDITQDSMVYVLIVYCFFYMMHTGFLNEGISKNLLQYVSYMH